MKMSGKTISVNGNSIKLYESEGKGIDVILVHGNSSSAQVFENQVQGDIGKRHHLIAIDLPGHGNSSKSIDQDKDYNIAGYASLVKSICQQLNLNELVIGGHSLGGNIALEAGFGCQGLKGYFICGTPPSRFPPNFLEMFLPSEVGGSLMKNELTDSEIELWIKEMSAQNNPLPEFVANDLKKTDGSAREFLGKGMGEGKFMDEVDMLRKSKAPLAIFVGEQDRVVNLEYIENLNLPNLWKEEIHIVQEAGHFAQTDNPDHFNRMLLNFLDELL